MTHKRQSLALYSKAIGVSIIHENSKEFNIKNQYNDKLFMNSVQICK